MIDIQNEQDVRKIPLQKVGVRNLEYPVKVLDKTNKFQSTTATVDLFVNLPHNFKGTHMSRFIQIFHKFHTNISMQHFLEMLEEIRAKMNAENAYGTISFPYFIEKSAPVSKEKGIIFSALNAILIIWIIVATVIATSNITMLVVKDYEYTYEEYKLSYCNLEYDTEGTCENDYTIYKLDKKNYNTEYKRNIINSLTNVILVSIVLIILNKSKKK